MIVVVFSYNRGPFLAHCVRSIERCAPQWPICVIDDNSDDPETRRELDQIEQRHRVIRGHALKEHKHGGLYANLQLALETFADEPMVLSLQDDVQMVRPVDEEDEREWTAFFDRHPQSAFLQPCFLRGISRRQLATTWDQDAGVYWAKPSSMSAGVHYSDLHITRPGRLLENGWQFHNSEPANDRQAAHQFGAMAYLHSPIAMWLPLPPAYRGRQKTIALTIAERRTPTGMHPFEYLDTEQTEGLRRRSSEILPIAEDFLTNKSLPAGNPWRYYPLQGRGWLKKLHHIEAGLRRLFT